MEIDELKSIWRKESEGFIPRNEAELTNMLKGKSSSIVSRLKRNVWLELVFTFLGGIGLLAYAVTLPGGALKWTSVSILILFAAYTLYYIKKIRLLRQFERDDNLRMNLRRLTDTLETYLKFYRRSYSILYPVYFVLALLFAAVEHGTTGFLSMISRTGVLLTLLAGAGAFFICSTWLTDWYLRKLYGGHLENLKNLLQELED